jgi:hypothetical protein
VFCGAAQVVFAVIAAEIGQSLVQIGGTVVRTRSSEMGLSGETGRVGGRSAGSVDVVARAAYLLHARASRLADVFADLFTPAAELVDAVLQFLSALVGLRLAALSPARSVLAHAGQRSCGHGDVRLRRLPVRHQISGGRASALGPGTATQSNRTRFAEIKIIAGPSGPWKVTQR